jgi:hypothetical protein
MKPLINQYIFYFNFTFLIILDVPLGIALEVQVLGSVFF